MRVGDGTEVVRQTNGPRVCGQSYRGTIERVECKVDVNSSLILYVFGGRWSVIGF